MDKFVEPSNAINDEYDVVIIATNTVSPGVVDGENMTNGGMVCCILIFLISSLSFAQRTYICFFQP
jgi:hypothetical protein